MFVELTTAAAPDFPEPVFVRADKVEVIYGMRHGSMVFTEHNYPLVKESPAEVARLVQEALVKDDRNTQA